MNALYVNDRHIFVAPEETEGDEHFDVRAIVAKATTVKTSRDFIDFMLGIPGSFFKWYAMPLWGEYTPIEQLVDENAPYIFKDSFVDTVDKYFPEIDVLDEVALQSGAIGEYVEDYPPQPYPFGPDSTVGILNIKHLRCIQLAYFEVFVKNIQQLERYGAIANGETSPFELRRIDFGVGDDIQFIDTGLSSAREYAIGFGQQSNAHDLFTSEQWARVREALIARGYDDHLVATEQTHDTEYPRSHIFVYPTSWTDQQVAADIFVSFMHLVFDDDEDTFLNYPFKVSYDAQGFHVRDNIGAIAACYREVAYLAEARSVRICAHCGHPLLADRSRGNEAMYCSRSCNTMASAARREKVYALAASGVPVDDAIARVGSRYERSIRRWYEESKELLS